MAAAPEAHGNDGSDDARRRKRDRERKRDEERKHRGVTLVLCFHRARPSCQFVFVAVSGRPTLQPNVAHQCASQCNQDRGHDVVLRNSTTSRICFKFKLKA